MVQLSSFRGVKISGMEWHGELSSSISLSLLLVLFAVLLECLLISSQILASSHADPCMTWVKRFNTPATVSFLNPCAEFPFLIRQHCNYSSVTCCCNEYIIQVIPSMRHAELEKNLNRCKHSPPQDYLQLKDKQKIKFSMSLPWKALYHSVTHNTRSFQVQSVHYTQFELLSNSAHVALSLSRQNRATSS